MKNIVLLSDGTGNSASALFKTNVWRLYQALDLIEPTESGILPQVACYNDGVGTSAFKPLAMLGGMFGWGLKRNVLHMYEFLCRNYQPGDRIHAFGFSRGAFTVRVLVGLIVTQGIVACDTDTALARATRDRYREFRRAAGSRMSPVVKPLRWLRDRAIAVARSVFGDPTAGARQLTGPGETKIAFLGVWDTVAAYGLPIAELTRGVDLVVWPLSMSDHTLSPNVELARHALALDDERNTFHPVLWDEIDERDAIAAGAVGPDRMRQVWFSGMHADVGGGYPDDGLAMTPLLWMLREAQAAGLRFRQDEVRRVTRSGGPSAPLHDSRKGLGGYYRYQPRRIDARTEKSPVYSLAMRDPQRGTRALLTAVNIHASVFQRIAFGGDRYAPVVLPEAYTVADALPGAPPPETTEQARRRFERQEAVWNDIWRKRIAYFAMLVVSASLVFFPMREASYLREPCEGWICDTVPPLIQVGGDFLPGFLSPWIEAFALSPAAFAVTVAIIAGLLWRGAFLQTRIRDSMARLWHTGPHATAMKPSVPWTDRPIQYVRSRVVYQKALRWLKWWGLPLVFGYYLLLLGVPTAIWAAYRYQVSSAEASGAICDLDSGFTETADPPRQSSPLFQTNAICWRAGRVVRAGGHYKVTLTVQEPWSAGHGIATDPTGFSVDRYPWYLWPVAPLLKRSYGGRWFQPFATIAPTANEPRVSLPLRMRKTGEDTYSAVFFAPVSGVVFLWVNSPIIDWIGPTGAFYRDNTHGSAKVDIEKQ